MAFLAAALPALTASTAAASTTAATAATASGIAASTAAAGLIGTGIETASIPIAATAASSSLGWLGTAGLATSLIGGGLSAFGEIKSGEAAKASAEYNADVANQNASQAKLNQQQASEAAMALTGDQEQKTRAAVGQMQANEAASGLNLNEGSNAQVTQSATELGSLDAMRTRENATKEAYGYKVASVNDQAQAALDTSEAKNDETAGYVGAAGTLIGTAGSSLSNYYKYKQVGGLIG